MDNRQKHFAILAPVAFYPWGLFLLHHRLFGLLKRSLRLKLRWLRLMILIPSYPLFFSAVFLVPCSLLTLELIIRANTFLLGDLADENVDFSLTEVAALPTLPAAERVRAILPERRSDDEWYSALTKIYAPVLLQQVGFRARFDVPVFIDFDGTPDARDNVSNGEAMERFSPGIYGEVTAETADSYFLTYSVYHIKDYDHPVREAVSSWTYHDNDNEGMNFRIEKSTMKIMEAEGWFHNRFFICMRSPSGSGTEPVQGRLLFENSTHPVFYVQSMGHGVRCAQPSDYSKVGKNIVVYRYRGDHPPATVPPQGPSDYSWYDLQDFSEWHRGVRQLNENRGNSPLFMKEDPLGAGGQGRRLLLPKYIATRNEAGFWSQPKPMWSWDDGWDRLPGPYWYFLPAETYRSHIGVHISEHYLRTPALERAFGIGPEEFKQAVQGEGELRPGKRFQGMWSQIPISRTEYAKGYELLLKEWVNSVFRKLG